MATLITRSIYHSSVSAALRLTNIDDGLGHCVGRLDDLRVRLEIALRGDHRDQLLGKIDVGILERAGLHLAQTRCAGRSDQCHALIETLCPGSVAQLTETFLIGKIGERHLAESA